MKVAAVAQRRRVRNVRYLTGVPRVSPNCISSINRIPVSNALMIPSLRAGVSVSSNNQ
jgi:hypothetical protein